MVPRRQNPRHDVLGCVHIDGFAGDVGVGVEFALPQRVAEHDDFVGVGNVFFGQEVASDFRMDAKGAKIIAGDAKAAELFWLSNLQHWLPGTVNGNFLETLILRFPIEVRRVADVFTGAVAAFLPYHREAVWVVVRERSQQDSVDQAEDSGVRADAEGKGEDGDGGEPRRLAQHANGKAQILPAGFHKRFPAGGADLFPRNVHPAALQAHGAKRILTAHALLHLFLGCHLQEAV